MAQAEDWAPPVSDAAVEKATGRDWSAWREALDKWAPGLEHKQIAERLREDYKLSGWWSQMVCGAWEMMTGRRDPHQRASDNGGKYQATASKMIAAPPHMIAEAFQPCDLSNWGPEGELDITKVTPDRSVNGAWSKGGRISVWMTVKGNGKTQVTLSHDGLENAEACDFLKKEWRAAMVRLKDRMEG